MGRKYLSRCPWSDNTDCICRAGAYCGGFDWDRTPLGNCPYYQKLQTVDINRIETRIMNECRACKNFGTNNCKENGCKTMIALCYLEELKTKVKPRKGSHITNSNSGFTYHGKDYEV